jgi:hypothetical protein
MQFSFQENGIEVGAAMHAQRTIDAAVAEQGTDLAFLALKAAIQLSRALKGENADEIPIKTFVIAIRDTPGVSSKLDREGLTANPQAVSLLSGALHDVRKGQPNPTALLRSISGFINQLESADPKERRDAQRDMRDFCLALHSRLLARDFPTKDADTILGGGLRRLGLC